MIYPSQAEFINTCMDKYLFTDMPSDQIWEAAHFPAPDCLGGEETLLLWSADHVVQGLLQSIEFDHQCFHGYRNKYDTDLLTAYYPQYSPLFAQLKSYFNSLNGKKAAITNQANGTGIFAPGMQSAGGKKTAELGVGIYGRSAEQMTADSKKGAAINKANGTGLYDPKVKSAGGKTTSSQRWQCLKTGKISTSGPLAQYQRARGIDTSLRKRVYCTTDNSTL